MSKEMPRWGLEEKTENGIKNGYFTHFPKQGNLPTCNVHLGIINKIRKNATLIFFRIVLKKHVLNGHMQYKHEEVHASFHQQI